MKLAKNITIERILNRGVEQIIVKASLEKKLASGKKLRIKFGIDPTAPDIHLGHTVALRKLRQFQDAGHRIILIIGDFTARIGDPSGRTDARKPLSAQEVKKNLKGYLKQASKIIDLKKTEIRYNSDWHEKKGLAPLLQLMRTASIQQVLKREDFSNRMSAGTDISLLETVYPLLQGYDSVVIRADVEIGGTDQTFNLLMGRRVQREFGQAEQDILTLPLLEGTDGIRKMSKSYGNYVGVDDEPTQMFGKIMAIPDSLISKYFELLTDDKAPEGFGPREAKLTLAEIIVEKLHNQKKALVAKEEFVRVFSKHEAPKEAPELKSAGEESRILDLVVKALPKESKSELRRLIAQGAVHLGERPFRDADDLCTPKKNEILKIGKHRFFKII
jgi:tyrosyl-tRNA synthetase